MSERGAAASPPITLGIDLGTSSVKVTALTLGDATLGEAAAAFDTVSSEALQAEQEPHEWLLATATAMRELARSGEAALGAGWLNRVGAIGLTGQLPTLVCLAGDRPLGRAVTWKDGRADAWAATQIDAERRTAMYAVTGMPIDGRYLAPMLQFHFKERLAEVTCVLSAKDYLLYALTGRRLTEPSTAAGYGTYDLQQRRFSTALCTFWNLSPALLPRLLPTNSLAGSLHAAGAALLGLQAGIPVSMGAADSVCASYAMAGLDPRVVSISFGTSAVVIGASPACRLDPAARYLVTPHVQADWFGLEMDLIASGTGHRWLSDLFGWQGDALERHAAQSVPGSRGLCFAPYLGGGEQGALWNPRLRGGIFGLTARHARADIARAYLEGVFYEIKRCVEVLAEAGPVDSVRVSGNIVQSPASTQMLADVLDRQIGTVDRLSPAASGAAKLARRILATGGPAEHRASTSPVETSSSAVPDAPTARRYAMLYRDYLARAATCE